jgi:hypothetical protein
MTLARKHVVCGKVTDEKGDPLPKTEVYAYAHLKGSSWLTVDDPEDMRTTADTNGNYQFDLDPGEYFIRAGGYTWYSGTERLTQIQAESLANAEAVEVGADKTRNARRRFLLGRELVGRADIFGVAIADDPALTGSVVLSLLEVNRTGAIHPYWDWPDQGRTFDLTVASPGSYRLVLSNGRFPQSWAGPPSEFHVLASRDITLLESANLDGITLRSDPLASLTGHVTLENITPRAACPTQEKPHVSIQKDDDGHFQQMELGFDGSFAFPYVALGTYTVRFYPFLRGRTYVKSMLFGGHPTDGRKINLSLPGPHALEVVLSGTWREPPGTSRRTNLRRDTRKSGLTRKHPSRAKSATRLQAAHFG